MKTRLISTLVLLSLLLSACGGKSTMTSDDIVSMTSGIEESNSLVDNCMTTLPDVEAEVLPIEERVTGEEDKETAQDDAFLQLSCADDSLDTPEQALLSTKDENGIAEDVDQDKIIYLDEPKVMYVQSSVNVRTGPSTEHERIDNYKVNTPVTILGRYGEQGWYLIQYKEYKAFISNKYLADEEVDLEALKAKQEAEALAAIEANQAQMTSEQANQTVPAGILFIGDSRCVQMQEAVGGGNSSWVAENSKGYEWFSTKGLERAEPSIGKGTKVVICLGVNDTSNANKYAELVNSKAAEWAARGAKTYYVSVNPVTENPYTTQEQVELFNSTIIGQLVGVHWIDTYSYLVSTGYGMVDGLHYDSDTYIKIFNAVVGSLK